MKNLVHQEKSAARNPGGQPVRAEFSIIQSFTRTRRYTAVGAPGGRERGILKYYELLNYLLSPGGAPSHQPALTLSRGRT